SDPYAAAALDKTTFPGTITVSLNEGDNAFELNVTAESGIQKRYRLTIRRQAEHVQLSDNANLSSLTVKADGVELALTPAFTAGTDRYEAETAASTVSIEAVPADAHAAVTLDNAPLTDGKNITLAEGD